MPLLEWHDLAPFATIPPEKADAMINAASALAEAYAPGVTDDLFEKRDAARAILLQVVLRWNDAGSGVVGSKQAGPYGETISVPNVPRGLFWDTEIAGLRSLTASDEAPSTVPVYCFPDPPIDLFA